MGPSPGQGQGWGLGEAGLEGRTGWWGSWTPGTPTGTRAVGRGQVPCQMPRTPLGVILAEWAGPRPSPGMGTSSPQTLPSYAQSAALPGLALYV